MLTGHETKAMFLFELETDPAEQHDVADHHQDVVKRLKELYDQMMNKWPRLRGFSNSRGNPRKTDERASRR